MRAFLAQMAELVDALGSGPSARKGVEVRVLFWAPIKKSRLKKSAFFIPFFPVLFTAQTPVSSAAVLCSHPSLLCRVVPVVSIAPIMRYPQPPQPRPESARSGAGRTAWAKCIPGRMTAIPGHKHAALLRVPVRVPDPPGPWLQQSSSAG